MLGHRSHGRARLRACLGLVSFAYAISRSTTLFCAEPLPFVVEYRPGDGCAAEERFSEHLLARTARVRRARPGEISLRYRIWFTGSRDALVGHFASSDFDGNEMTRAIPTAKCDEMVAAMALIAAILIEPNGAIATDHASAPTFTTPRENKSDAGARPSTSHTRWVFAAGVAAFLASALAPDPLVGFASEFDAKYETQRLLSPWIGLAAMQTLEGRFETAAGTAVFDWRGLRLTMSPVRWPANGAFALRPALFAEVGRLSGSGRDTIAPGSTRVLWTAAGALLRVEVNPIRWFAFAFDAGLVAPLRHDSFFFAPNPPLFRVPALGFWGQLGASVQF